jgi:prepilin signal peptidase PulO-like enzyme (type II secretory pathway)
MTTTDYLINFALIALVLFQVRDSRLTTRSLLRPVFFVAAAAFYYLKGLPTAGNDVGLYAVFMVVGIVFGVLCGLTTHVWRANDGFTHTRAGVAAALFWVLGIGSRLAFEEYWNHGGGGTITNFSISHQITSQDAWIAALVLMALVEVVSRLVVIRLRGSKLSRLKTKDAAVLAGSAAAA